MPKLRLESSRSIFLLAGLGFTLLGLVLSQNQLANTFLEDLLHPVVRKLFLPLKQTILHLQSRNHCWTWQLLLAFEIWAIKLRPKGLRPCETMTVLVKLGEN